MQIICTTAARFFNAANTVEEVNKQGDKVKTIDRSLHNSVTITPSNHPQLAPDWIKSDPLFALLEKAGTLIEVEVKTAIPAIPQVPQGAAPSGWGAKPENAGLGFQTPAKTE